jgi:hypothetical protein
LLVFLTAALTAVTAFLAGFTRGLMNYTRKLWSATNDLVERTEATDKRVRRARISAGPSPSQRRGHGIEALFIANYGPTMAFLENIAWGVCLERDYVNGMAPDRATKRPDMWPPNQAMTEYLHVFFERDSVQNLIFWGRVDYKDIWGDRHYTEWKFQIAPNGWDIPLQGTVTDEYPRSN